MHASCRPEVKVNLVHPARKSRPRADREDSQEELVCVDLARSRPSTAQGKLVKAYQVPDENPGVDEGLNLLGLTLVLPAIQSIELPRDYSRAEQPAAFPLGQAHLRLTQLEDNLRGPKSLSCHPGLLPKPKILTFILDSF